MSSRFATSGRPPHPKAFRVEVHECGSPTCHHPHLIAFDGLGRVIVEIVMPDEAVFKCMKILEDK